MWVGQEVRSRFWVLALISLFDILGTACYAGATRHGLLAVVAVAANLYPLATVMLGRVVLGERVARIQEIGIVMALLGVVMIAAG